MTDDQIIRISAGELKALIAEGVAKGLESCPAGTCPIPEEARQELIHFFGMIKDVGEGQMSSGVEAIRQNHLFTFSARSVLKKTANKIYYTLLIALLSGIGGLVYLGIQHFKV